MEKSASKEKIGLRGAMPPGFLLVVYDSESGNAEYIPPECSIHIINSEWNEKNGLVIRKVNAENSGGI